GRTAAGPRRVAAGDPAGPVLLPAQAAGRNLRGRPARPHPGLRVAMQWALEAQQLLAEDWGVAAEVWSATSWTELRREAMACDRWNQLHPDQEQRVPYLTEKLNHSDGPVLAAS